jgi:serine/threonine protein kinase
MNPDDLLGRTPPGVQSDLWALAVTMYLMLTKRLPFRAHSAGMWQNPLAWRFDPPSRHRAEVPSLVDAWFRRAFSRDPLQRFQSAADACREFRGALVKTRDAARSVRPCLSDDELLAFATGSMSPREVQLADAHIAWCEACSDVLSTIAALSFEQTPPGAHL